MEAAEKRRTSTSECSAFAAGCWTGRCNLATAYATPVPSANARLAQARIDRVFRGFAQHWQVCHPSSELLNSANDFNISHVLYWTAYISHGIRISFHTGFGRSWVAALSRRSSLNTWELEHVEQEPTNALPRITAADCAMEQFIVLHLYVKADDTEWRVRKIPDKAYSLHYGRLGENISAWPCDAANRFWMH